ncbi:MAG TPA: hypothetical protein VFR94_04525 [Nitrososphaeraceae archaeon]|nr:hypothetical protein [Nitrososphaeraceae archaeon]
MNIHRYYNQASKVEGWMVTYSDWLTITEEVKQKYQKDDVVQARSLYDKDYAGYCKWSTQVFPNPRRSHTST